MPNAPTPTIERIARFGLVVSDVYEAERFFEEAFDFVTVERFGDDRAYAHLVGLPDSQSHRTLMRLGGQELMLTAFEPPGRPYPPGSTSTDIWFQHFAIIVTDIAAAYARLQEEGRFLPISEGGPVKLPAASGGVEAFKFRDLDGHPLELLAFPAGKEPEPWKARGSELFLGMDHSAISVGDTGTSVSFFERCFGLKKSMQSENAGPEQARMDAVPGARVTVTGLAPVHAPPHVELLGYHVGERRPIAGATRADDIAATCFVLETNDLAAVAEALTEAGATFVSPGLVALADGRHALAVLDPDGHRFIVEEARR